MIRLAALLVAFLFLSLAPARAEEPIDMAAFGRIPVMHEGRIKPLSRFAAIELEAFSGGRAHGDATAWLAEALFNPEYAATRPVFALPHPGLAERLRVPREAGLYSIDDLAQGLDRTQRQAMKLAADEGGEMTPEQAALVRVHENALAYGQIIQAMTAFLPLNIEAPSSLGIPQGVYGTAPTWLEARKKEHEILAKVRAIVAEKGDNPGNYSDEEKAIALLSWQMDIVRQAGERSVLLRVIPPQWDGSDAWLSPWELLRAGQGSPQSAALLDAWQDMAASYRNGDKAAWTQAAARARAEAISQSGDPGLGARLDAEVLYSTLRPFPAAAAFYGLSFLAAAGFLFTKRRFFYAGAIAAACAALALHGAGIGMRVFILQRPPVGSLYESLLFVGMATAAAALALEARRRDGIAMAGGAVCAGFILLISPATAPEGDDLQMLTAVLNTNFWLATHVLCITAGYGLCLLTAAMAHVRLARGTPDGNGDGLTRTVYMLSLGALLLTATGTVLGGIWADQSWGRFWGWDPKENGALLIVLWLIWLHHGRIGGQLKAEAFYAGLCLLSVTVGLAWFGVNLLSVGLHSYGFTSGTAAGLAAFCAAEFSVTGLLYLRARKRRAA